MTVACLAALGLRGADWRMQGFAWISITILLAAVAVADAVHASVINLPQKPAAGVMAVIPWVLLLPQGDLANGAVSIAGRWDRWSISDPLDGRVSGWA